MIPHPSASSSPDHEESEGDTLGAVLQQGGRVLVVLLRLHRGVVQHRCQQVYLHFAIFTPNLGILCCFYVVLNIFRIFSDNLATLFAPLLSMMSEVEIWYERTTNTNSWEKLKKKKEKLCTDEASSPVQWQNCKEEPTDQISNSSAKYFAQLNHIECHIFKGEWFTHRKSIFICSVSASKNSVKCNEGVCN